MRAILFLVCATGLAQNFPTLNTSPWLGQELLAQVESNSVVVNVVFDTNMQVFVEYGTATGAYVAKTAIQMATAGVPSNVVLSGLAANTRYFYRLQYGAATGTTFTARAEHSFTTQRPRGTAFSFVVQADPHLDNNSTSDVYKLSLANMLTDKPDFLVDLGDTMLTDKLSPAGIPVDGGASPTEAGVLSRTRLLRSYYDLAAHSLPLFETLGNHEGEWGSNLNGTPNNFAIWDVQDRTGYFPTPAPDKFFSGDSQSYDLSGNLCIVGQAVSCGLGQRRSYYAWEWGDALFVVLDPFWSQTADSTNTQAGNGKNCCQKNAGYWSVTLGTVQYDWLKRTLENSTAAYKFVFSHNLVGGTNMTVNGVAQGPLRGGVESAKYLEWGGYNLDGSWGFDTYRPELPMPIHQLLVANRVTAYFHGHDHLYAHQTLDGVTYQEVPQPSATNANLGTRGSDYGYVQGTMVGGRGYLRVQVAPPPAGVTVQYVESWLPSEQKGTIVNGMVADSYKAGTVGGAVPVIAGIGNAASGNTSVGPNMWLAIVGTNLAPAGDSRTWQNSDFVNNQMPTQLDGVSVSVNGTAAYVYFVSPGQVNVLTPPDVVPGPVTVRVTVNGVVSSVFSGKGESLTPAFFTFDGTYVAATHADGSPVGATAPAKPGETIVVYGTGFGPTSVALIGGVPKQSGTLKTPPVIQIAGLAATVTFAGLVAPGEFQFNLVVPSTVTDGDLPIIATYGGVNTQAGVVITIKK